MTRDELVKLLAENVPDNPEVSGEDLANEMLNDIESFARIPITAILSGESVVVSRREAMFLHDHPASLALYQPSSLALKAAGDSA